MSAVISPCGKYRYALTRHLPFNGLIPARRACIVMVNPSTADATQDDATIRKLFGFAQRHGWSEFTVVNKFAYRATDVNELRDAVDPIGPDNDNHILCAMAQADIIVVAWGRLKKLPLPLWLRYRYIVKVAAMLGKPLYCLGTCDDGHPRHPVMLPYDTPLTIWEPPHA
jgi:hypothetical protein